MDSNSFMQIPEIEMNELSFLKSLGNNLGEKELLEFTLMYSSRRRSPRTILICTLMGFFIVAGIQHFITNRIGMGILYLLTGGFCMIGTIVDLVNYRQLALEYNKKQALEIFEMQKMTRN